MKTKIYRSFSLINTKNYDWDLGYRSNEAEDVFVKYRELNAPTLNCNIDPMPAIYRSSKRRHLNEQDILFMADGPLDLAS